MSVRKTLRRLEGVRRRAQERERRHAWLFPVVAPFCLAAALGASLTIPVVQHWQAVEKLEAMGGHVRHAGRSGSILGIESHLLNTVHSVRLTGPSIDDEALRLIDQVRGVKLVVLAETRVTDAAVERLRRDRPGLVVMTDTPIN